MAGTPARKEITMHRRTLVFGALGLALGGSRRAWAAGIRPFDKNAFIAAQDAGKSIIVFIHAPW
jgi:hypothetical protein